jgi:hypothetical protein
VACEGGEVCELAPPAFGDGPAELARETCEEQEGPRLAPVLAHEHERDVRREEQDRGERVVRGRVGQRDQPLAERPVAGLVVVLEEVDEGRGRKMGRRLAPVRALEGEPLGQSAGKVAAGIVGEGAVVGVCLAGGQHMGRVVHVVVPFGGVERHGALRPLVQVGDVAVVLGRQVYGAVGDAGAHLARKLDQKLRLGGIADLVDGVEPQTVHAELREPVERVLDEEAPHGALRVVDPGAPRRVPGGVEERRRVGVEVIPLRSEVVVDHVEKHHEPPRVRGVDKRPQVVRSAVGGMRGIGQDAVIAPAAVARELRHRHDLDGGETRLHQRVKTIDRGAEGALGGECADVQLADHGLLPRASHPVRRPWVLRADDE